MTEFKAVVGTDPQFPAFSFRLPQSFHELPLGASLQSSRWEKAARDLAPDGSSPGEAVGLLRGMASALSRLPIVHASFCKVSQAPQITAAGLIACLTYRPIGTVDVATQAIAQALSSEAWREREVKPVVLPCGPAVGVASQRMLSFGHEGNRLGLRLTEFAVHVPHPVSLTTLTFVLSTPFTYDSALYGGVMGGIARSLRFRTSSRADW